MSSPCLAIHWLCSPPFGGMRTIGVTAGAMDPDEAICLRFSMYCRQSRSALMSYGLCSISNTTPSYGAVLMVRALPTSPGEKVTNAGLPDASARMAPFRRGISGIFWFPCMILCRHQVRNKNVFRAQVRRRQSLFGGEAQQHLDRGTIGRHAIGGWGSGAGVDKQRVELACQPGMRFQQVRLDCHHMVDRPHAGATAPCSRGRGGIRNDRADVRRVEPCKP